MDSIFDMVCKCGCSLYKIEYRTDCYNCQYNEAWDNEAYEYTNDEEFIKINKLIRSHAEDQGECDLGDSWNNGCYIFKCSNCGKINHLPILEE